MGVNNFIIYYKIIFDFGIFVLDIIFKFDGIFDFNFRFIRVLDRELMDKYIVYVSALDGGNFLKFGIFMVNILVIDINDKVFIFIQQIYNVIIKEDFVMNFFVV